MITDVANNKKALRDFHILEKFECGIELRGTEVKAIRDSKVNIRDAYARVENGQVFLYGCDIQPWQTAGQWFQHEAKRPRRLLLHKAEIYKMDEATHVRGETIVALKLYFKGRHVKLEIGTAKGKTHGDQRHDLKKRVELKEAQREMARFNRGKE